MSKKHKKGNDQIRIVLPITPFLDMSFQLMFFFVLTFRPQAQEGQISMFLPKPPGTTSVAPPPPPVEEPLEPKEEYTIKVRSGGGEIVSISFVDGAGATEVGKQPRDLYDKLKSMAAPKGAKKPTIKIEAMKDLVYGRLVQLMDVCIKAGYDSVGVTELPNTAEAPMN